MKAPYSLKIKIPNRTKFQQREILAEILLRVAQRFSFLGMTDWEIELANNDKVLGSGTEFHDLTKGRDPKNDFQIFFQERKDAVLYAALIRKNFAELKFGPVEMERQRDWMRIWRKHYKPLCIGKSLWIYPAWLKIPARLKKAHLVRIHPGQAFGTGTHGTTSLCLELFLEVAKKLPEPKWRVLDFGAGTGILAIAAEKWAKLHGRKISLLATEIDPVARKQLRINARLNGSRLPVREKAPVGKKYDLLFANVLAPVLLAERNFLLDSLASGGYLFLSGILWSEAKKFQSQFRAGREFEVTLKRKGDWAAFRIHRN